MSEKTAKTIRIKWVRSGIGFTYHQKTIVRSLGLRKLNHTVVRPDTPQIRGIVASVPHLLEIAPQPAPPAWASIPEYTVHPPEPAPPPPAEAAPEAAAVPAETPAEATDEAVPALQPEEETSPVKAKAPKAKGAKAKSAKEDEKKEKPAAKKSKSTKGSKK